MKKLTPLQAIRRKCLDCMCFQPNEVKLCPSEDCLLFPYRFGRNPYHTHVRTPKQIAHTKELQELGKKKQKKG